MTPRVITVEADLPDDMTLAEWSRSRRTPRRSLAARLRSILRPHRS